MRSFVTLRRLTWLLVVLVALSIVPASFASESGSDSPTAAETTGSSLVQDVIDWLVDLIDGDGQSDSERGPQIDPLG